jgi:hypothetical protein
LRYRRGREKKKEKEKENRRETGRRREGRERERTGFLSPLICIQRPKLIHEIQGLKKPGGTNGNKGRGRRKMGKGDILGVVKKIK